MSRREVKKNIINHMINNKLVENQKRKERRDKMR
jgi:hypothetical protein